MKVGRRTNSNSSRATQPNKNHNRKNFLVILIAVITVVLITWVYTIGRKAEETVSVVMYTQDVYKNQVITEGLLKEYKMLKGEFEKYAVAQNGGQARRRILLWDERGKVINTFAAYPLHQDNVAMISDFVRSRVDNTDSVLYSFPGKNVLKLEIGTDELNTFKTFLEPGDKINVTAIYKTTETVYTTDSRGVEQTEEVEIYREETVFKDISIADMLNGSGESILDIYASYRDKSAYEQANLDANEGFKQKTQPASMIVALTPEEETLYYSFLGKQDVQFRVSIPQRQD